MKRNESSLTDLWETHQHSLYRGLTEKGHDKIFEVIITENLTNMVKEIATQIQEAQ